MADKKENSPEKEKEVVFQMTQESVNHLDNFFNLSITAHGQGVLNYEKAFFKVTDLVKAYLVRKEV